MPIYEDRSCSVCESSFQPRTVYSTKARYCSDACRMKARNQQFQRYRDAHPKPHKPPVVKNCLSCGKDFVVPPKGTGARKYCDVCIPLIHAEQGRLWKRARKRMKVWKLQFKKCKQCGIRLKDTDIPGRDTPDRLTHLKFCKECSAERRREYHRKLHCVRRTWLVQLGSNWRVHFPMKMVRFMHIRRGDIAELAIQKPPFSRVATLGIIGELTMTFLRDVPSEAPGPRHFRFALPEKYMESIGAKPTDWVWLDVMNHPRKPSAFARARLSIMSGGDA